MTSAASTDGFGDLAPSGFGIRMRMAGDDAELLRIERAASTLLQAAGHPDATGWPGTLADYQAWLDRHGVLVAGELAGEPAGFAAAFALEDLYWLAELSVDPAFVQRGLGTALLRATLDRARRRGHLALGLSTFVDVPFNAPFYARHGFERIGDDRLTAAMRMQFHAEAPTSALAAQRCVMVCRL
ncbi:GNAT family N-acetyltransferase [Consotaella aegiceratis]|uniref:GNAT family N-acetyltransferase n=1 Tax=Consotaella aegiceratis TaxID=3097961 RepID=UPI002F428A78